MNPLISVILPVYNSEKYLVNCLNSLINQSYDNLEIIVVNDGSTDKSKEILDNYLLDINNKGKIKVINTENNGVWKARKIGIFHANGQYIGFCGSDDVPEQNMYEELLKFAMESKADITICAYKRDKSIEMNRFGQRTINIEKNPDVLPLINTSLWNKLFTSEILKYTINFDESPRVLEDMMFLCSLYHKCKNITFIDKPLYNYLTRNNSAMYNVNYDEFDKILNFMIQTKCFVLKNTDDSRYNEICDLFAFIHLGLSFPSRLKINNDQNLFKILNNINKLLKYHFPLYLINKYCTINYNLKNNFLYLKPLIAKWFYQLKLFGILIWCYRFFTDKLKIEIKW